MVGDEKCQIFVFAEISDGSGCIDDILSVEGELDAGHLSAAKKLPFYDSDYMGRESGRENMDGGPIQQLRENLIQRTIGWSESGDAVSFYARKKNLVSFINVHMFYEVEEGVICAQETKKLGRCTRSRVTEELLW